MEKYSTKKFVHKTITRYKQMKNYLRLIDTYKI